MTATNTQLPASARWIRPVAILAMVFGVMTVFSGGNVLFGSSQAQSMAGNYVPFVVWFNFLAGFLYIVAAAGIWLRQGWAVGLAAVIAATTCLTALGFGYLVAQGQAYEMRTVGALVLRICVWVAITIALMQARRRS